MDIFKQTRNSIWIIPSIVALLIALVPTLNSQWPLTADIFYHIHIAQVYSQYGFTLTDPLVIDPWNGQKISYPPFFSFLLLLLLKLFNIDYFQAARILQPILAFFTVLSVSYVAKKFFGDVAGLSAGFLMISSYLFSRLLSPLPETLALIFIPLIIYFYYKSVEDKKYLYALIAGLLFLLLFLIHQAAPIIIFLVISSISIFLCVYNKNIRFLLSYLAFLIIPVMGIGFVFFALSSIFSFQITNGLPVASWLYSLLKSYKPIGYFEYIAVIGMPVLFAIIGGIVSIKRMNNKSLLIFIWILIVFIISIAYLFGIKITSIRLLIYLLLPLSILGGLGLSYLYYDYKKTEFKSQKIRTIFLVTTLIIASLFAITLVEDPKFGFIPKYNNGPQIVPPTDSEIDIAEWFIKNGYDNYTIMSNSFPTALFISVKTERPIVGEYAFNSAKLRSFKGEYFDKMNVGYLVLDKRLNDTISDENYIYIAPKAQILYENQLYYIYKIGP